MHPFRAFIVFLFCLCALLALVACETSEQGNALDAPEIEQQVAELLEAMQANDFDAAIALYDESFFKTTSPEAWRDKLKTVMAERGPMRSFSLRRSQADTRFSGKFFILEYNSVHEGNKRLHHILTLVLPVTGGDIQLLGHKMTPWEDKQ